MRMNEILMLIEELCSIPGVSGDEGRAREAIEARIKGYCDYTVDALGNLLVHKKGGKRAKNRLMLSAHMDEVGLIITHVEDSGLLRFAAVGGIDRRVVPGKAVEIGESRIWGVIGAKATHQLNEKEKEETLALDKLYIDIGAESGEEAKKLVKPGARAVFASRYTRLGDGESGHKLMGRALDDRAGCALLVALIRSELEYDCDFAFTVQEETGSAGAAAAAYTLKPDISVVVETTTASDIAGVAPDKTVCAQGKGPVISFMDKRAIYDAELYALAIKTAEDACIPCQSKAGVFGGNDTGLIQASRGGARCLAVNLPCRYLHTAACVLDERDIKNTLELLERLIPELAGV